MTRIVVFHLLSPGELQDQRHTLLGKQQIRAAITKHLYGIALEAAYCTAAPYAEEAVEIALQMRDENLNPVRYDEPSAQQSADGADGLRLLANQMLHSMTAIASTFANKEDVRRKPRHVLVAVGQNCDGLMKPADIMRCTLRHNGNEWCLISTHTFSPPVARSSS